ncbi:siderophore ABC transporter substrate-binding protein [Lysinibacillus sp. fkY74-1]|uniref:siderophore ABC transporter substrate-binding protein n=1 Tax=Lysinibacillus TaxID=400634 RepID=UPI0004DEF680|nr:MULTISPECIES: siderophore ABC transporter substrate-binding protein [Lysinibacillus]MBG9691938.1 ferrichrome ABC transporter substrate-binding protein [Lysinibacillus sphaericus]MBI6864001.1 siderophore ABC transporter substrate-binding protein [Lysinibacillus fusiformis]MEB7454950.1 siderophore ABC transporter substrate-binding protein [Lysinibacillus sphaericus]QPA54158.1 siderophore ABC transporter substrate-binding protein [Lysinibacillus sphaericus]QPA58495.1 siderophore ABC transporte
MKKWKLLTILMAMMLLVLAACGSKDEAKEEDKGTSTDKPAEEKNEASAAYPITIPGSTIEGRDGKTTFEEVKLDKIPEKVVVFDNGFLDTLDALGVNPTAVVQDSLPSYLSKYKDSTYVNAGTLFEPDYEKLSEINPDIIFISGRASAAYAELSKIAPTVYIGVDNKNFLESFKANTELAGKIFGKEKEAADAIAAYEAKVEEVKGKATASEEKALIVLGSEGALSAYGSGSRFGVIHDVFGVKAADENVKVGTHGDNVSFEYVRDTNPDILFVVDRDAVVNENGESGTKGAIENEIVSATNAVKNGKVFYLDPEVWYLSGGGLQSETLKVEDVLKAFN